jgi:hypothetical protein
MEISFSQEFVNEVISCNNFCQDSKQKSGGECHFTFVLNIVFSGNAVVPKEVMMRELYLTGNVCHITGNGNLCLMSVPRCNTDGDCKSARSRHEQGGLQGEEGWRRIWGERNQAPNSPSF